MPLRTYLSTLKLKYGEDLFLLLNEIERIGTELGTRGEPMDESTIHFLFLQVLPEA